MSKWRINSRLLWGAVHIRAEIFGWGWDQIGFDVCVCIYGWGTATAGYGKRAAYGVFRLGVLAFLFISRFFSRFLSFFFPPSGWDAFYLFSPFASSVHVCGSRVFRTYMWYSLPRRPDQEERSRQQTGHISPSSRKP